MPEALPNRLFISVGNGAFDATFVPRCTKFRIFSLSFRFILIVGKIFDL